MDRRQLLKAGLGGMGSLVLPVAMISQASADEADLGFDLTRGVRKVNLLRPATGERLHIEYMRDGVWQGDAYNHICWMLRDVQAGEHVRMDVKLIAILDWTQRYMATFGHTAPLHILSGYRSARTNDKTEGAAKTSQHLLGKAVDLRIPGVSAVYMSKLFNWLSQGGVGLYTDSNFTHLDTGRVRQWRG
jgi:uncharacterized protein YcbK (DUF882 family)